MAVLLLLCGVAVAGATLVSIFLGVSQVRRRTVGKDEEEQVESLTSSNGAVEEVYSAAKHDLRQDFQAQPAQIWNAAGVSAVLLIAMAAILYFAIWHEGGAPAKTKCKPPTWQERIVFFGDLRGFTHPINTAAPDAQKLFDQGMLLSFGFNQFEASQSFMMAAQLDPSASMPVWGIAYSLGPGANREVVAERKWYPSFSPEDFPACYKHAQRALELAQKAAAADNTRSQLIQKELAYAEAQAARFANGTAQHPERNVAQRRYAELMEDIGTKYADTNAKALAAEGYMTLHQWDYYDGEGRLKPHAEVAERLLREVLKEDPQNSLAHHLHIHVAETARQTSAANDGPKRAEVSGEAMTFREGPWDAKIGHLVHMPGHIFIRVGRWKDAVTANIRAFNADMALSKKCMVAYGPEHNTDMLIYAANMAGLVSVAEEYGGKLRTYPDIMEPAAYGDSTKEWTHLVLTKVMFAKWDDILTIETVPDVARGQCPLGGQGYAAAIFHYARTLALAAKAAGAAAQGFDEERARLLTLAEAELALLKAAEEKVIMEEPTVPGGAPGVYGCDYKTLAQIAVLHAEARLALLNRNAKAAVEKLEAAKVMEDRMAYMEPPRLYQPIRHCLGYVHLNATGDFAAAEQAYMEDLQELPNNGWSLLGLGQALQAQQHPEAKQLLAKDFPAAWQDAEVGLGSSCLAFSEF